jgi:hypothetical protein
MSPESPKFSVSLVPGLEVGDATSTEEDPGQGKLEVE